MISILYIGNDLAKKTKYNSMMATLSNLLMKEDFIVYRTSNKTNKIARILDMCYSVIKYRKVDYLLIDTFSTTNFYYALITSQLARIFKKKYIPILHGGNLPSRINNSNFFANLIFNNSYRNIAPSNYLKVEFEKKDYVVDFIPNILEIETYKYKERVKLAPKLLWVRAFKKDYNPSLAIEITNLLIEKYPNIKLCMVGPIVDSSYDETLKLISKYKLNNNVEITGVLQKEEWHKKSEEYDIFINTTDFDNTPVSLMEAMALGLPIVSTNVGGLPYLINNNIDGFLVVNKSPRAMADIILSIIENNDINIAKNARIKAESFGWGNVKKKWISLLK